MKQALSGLFSIVMVLSLIFCSLPATSIPVAAKSYGTWQLLMGFDIDLPECWSRPTHEGWYTCEEYTAYQQGKRAFNTLVPRTIEYVWPRTVSYTEFSLPSEGSLLMEVVLTKDATHNGWLEYDLQRYDTASAKWVSIGWYWKSVVQIDNGKQYQTDNTQYDLSLLGVDSEGKPWHPVLKNFPLYPAGKYRLFAWEPVWGQLDAYLPAKGSFAIVYMPKGTGTMSGTTTGGSSGTVVGSTGTGQTAGGRTTVGSSTGATGTGTGGATGAGSQLAASTAVLRDYDKSGDSFSFAKGKTCSGCNYSITDEDFFIADRGAQSIIHAFESPGVIDMGAVPLESVKEAPASGYQDTVVPVEGHTYVFKSRGKYGKIYLNDIQQPPVRTVTEYEFKWAWQSNGTRTFSAAGSQVQSQSGQTDTGSTPQADIQPQPKPKSGTNPLTSAISKICPLGAAYGSPEDRRLVIFRQFRDRVLAGSAAGRELTALYYAVSPGAVDLMEKYGFLVPAVRYGLAEPAYFVLHSTAPVWNE